MDKMFVSPGAADFSLRNRICKEKGLQGRVMWFDAEANIWELSTREGIRENVSKCKDANINTIILDVKPLAGLVLYQSKIAPRLKTFEGREYPADHDLLARVIEEAQNASISVHAAVNVFSEGSQILRGGPAFDHPDWQCVMNEPDGLVRAEKLENVHQAVFVNPSNPEVREYELSVIKEIFANYPVDGVVMDRMRYPNLYADFSDITRSEFERFIREKVRAWPDDVLVRNVKTGEAIKGPLFPQWLKFRALTIKRFLEDVCHVVKTTRPSALLGAYVGSWYPLYFDVGVNWASTRYKPGYDWWPNGYEQTGYADIVDYLCTGCYYSAPTREDALKHGVEEWRSVEAAAEESMAAVMDDTLVYGSVYVREFKDHPEDFVRGVQQCLDKTQGCMLFDLVQVKDYDYWGLLKEIFPNPAQAPHDVAEVMDEMRKLVP